MFIESTVVQLVAIIISVAHVAGLLSALEALYMAPSAQGAIAWGLFLTMFPYLGLPVYWTFGRSKFKGYREKIARVAEHQTRGLDWYRGVLDRFAAREVQGMSELVEPFVAIAGAPFVKGNTVKLLIDGEETFQALFAALNAAQRYILLEFFIIKDDALGVSLRQALIGAAQRGVSVFVLYDEIGSHSLSGEYISELRSHGIHVAPFGTRKGLRNFFQVNFRNHRKIVVVDGQTAFHGGLNVGDEYMGRNPRFGRWRDTHLLISGPTVAQLLGIFVSDWVWATGAPPEIDLITPTPTGDIPALTMASGPADTRERCVLFFLHAICSARSRVWISSPYFVPDDALLHALRLAALRGVDVRIILPARRDHTLVWLASFFFVPAVASHGVKVYRYEDGFLHQKAILVDDSIAAVGSANFDNRSFRLNFEATTIVADRGFASSVATMLEADMANSLDVSHERMSDYPIWKRFGAKFARLFAPVL